MKAIQKMLTGLAFCASAMLAVSSAEASLVTSGVDFVQRGGSFDTGNVAIGATAFAPNIEGSGVGVNLPPPQPTGYNFGSGPSHTTTGVNNGVYGNTGAWLAGSPNSFIGLDLGGLTTVSRVAYGRDNNAGFGDRANGLVTLQYTAVAAPGLATTNTGNSATGWQTIGTMDYTHAGSSTVFTDRHAFNFDSVSATGLRLVTAVSGRGIDEFEAYSNPLTSIIQDESTNATGIGFTFAGAPTEPAPGNLLYGGSLSGNTGTVGWTPLLDMDNVTVEVSWGVSFNHNQDVDYFFDPDGAAQSEIALTQGVNQTLFANQLTNLPVGQAWSGFFEIASGLTLTPESTFRMTGSPVQGGSSPEAVVTAVWRFSSVAPIVAPIPEPATMGLLAMGVLALGRRRRNVAVMTA